MRVCVGVRMCDDAYDDAFSGYVTNTQTQILNQGLHIFIVIYMQYLRYS